MKGLNFIERIEEILHQMGKTRADLSKDLNIPYQKLSDCKRRGGLPSGDVCIKIANYLGVSAEYLILGEETKKDADIESATALLYTLPKAKRAPVIAIIKSQVEFWKNQN